MKKKILKISTLISFALVIFSFTPIFEIHFANATCTETSTTFCAQQVIVSSILTFLNIPQSFSFPTITVSSDSQNAFSNTGAGQPDSNDLLGVQDTRDSGGFDVQIQASGTFNDGTGNTIPLTNLYVATSTSSSYEIPGAGSPAVYPATDYGVIYSSDINNKSVSAPLDIGTGSLGTASSFSANLGGGAVVLMNGQKPESSGRSGNMYQFVSYYLRIPESQIPGQYAIVLTYTLLDDTI